ncbi:MAG TPA: energy transducer TonB [Flavobacterium sp.]|nr:energy transducer TonB [Flavobacterium sp.]
MSRLSIYETRWIDLIFENRNKKYGAYQLRRDCVKSSFTALFMGLLFVFSIGIIAKIISNFNNSAEPATSITKWSEPLDLTDVYIQEVEKPVNPNVKNQTTEATIIKDQLNNPEIVQSQEASQNIATNAENNNASDVISNGTGTAGENHSTATSGAGTEIPETIDYGNTLVSTAVLDKMPEFPGGIQKFYNYVGNNFEKPDTDEIINFKVYVSFVIERDGSMTDIKVIKDPGYGMGKEAFRVLKSLKTKWSPGIINSKPVRTSYNLPISVVMN